MDDLTRRVALPEAAREEQAAVEHAVEGAHPLGVLVLYGEASQQLIPHGLTLAGDGGEVAPRGLLEVELRLLGADEGGGDPEALLGLGGGEPYGSERPRAALALDLLELDKADGLLEGEDEVAAKARGYAPAIAPTNAHERPR